MPSEIVSSYVFIGYDQEDEARLIKKNPALEAFGNYVDATVAPVTHYTQRVSANTPANIILLAHGGNTLAFSRNTEANRKFLWRNDRDGIPIEEFFKALPRSGINSIVVNSCDIAAAALSDTALASAPPGSIVMTLTKTGSNTIAAHSASFIREVTVGASPIDLMLKVYDNFDPQTYYKTIRYLRQRDQTRENANPSDALPEEFGIGGKPPLRVNLSDESKAIQNIGASPDQEIAWKSAIDRISKAFDASRFVSRPNNSWQSELVNPSAEDQAKLIEKITEIASLMRSHGIDAMLKGKDDIEKAEIKRITYALTATYLDESGQIGRWRAQQIARGFDNSNSIYISPNGDSITPAASDNNRHISKRSF